MRLISAIVEETVSVLGATELVGYNTYSNGSHLSIWEMHFVQTTNIQIDIMHRGIVARQMFP